MEVALIVALVAMAVVILALALLGTTGRSENLDQRLDQLNLRLGEVTGQTSTYFETLETVNQKLGGLTETSNRMLEVGQDMRRLQELLAAPTLRGAVGERMLEGLLRQTLPAGSYKTQHTFRNGHRVDAAIQLADGLVPVDAKFPLESFRRFSDADQTERGRHLRSFRRDVKGHVDAIAEKYICPGETLDFALMYIPAENVYYEIILKEESNEDLIPS